MNKPIVIVQGAQYGSEAKGAIAGFLCRRNRIDIIVRTGATNAGHTVYWEGKPIKMQQLPVGWVNPNTILIIGAGALIDPEILMREIEEVSRLTGKDIRQRLIVDPRAGTHFGTHADDSARANRHHLIGATGKGCSSALVDRIMQRGAYYQQFEHLEMSSSVPMADTEQYLNDAYDRGASIMLEGTQGQLLDLYLGPYPYVTHKQTGPTQWMLECGLSPTLPTEIVAVVRTYPIRVAGNSGPLPNEITWPVLAREINKCRHDHGRDVLVKEESIQAFETYLDEAARSYILPVGYTAHNQPEWPLRIRYREALSELNTTAWKMLNEEQQFHLSRLFELTTVTKKLRRVAALSKVDLQISGRQMRPTWCAVTFMNHVAPHKWFMEPHKAGAENRLTDAEKGVISAIESNMRAPVRLVSYGPEDNHILEL